MNAEPLRELVLRSAGRERDAADAELEARAAAELTRARADAAAIARAAHEDGELIGQHAAARARALARRDARRLVLEAQREVYEQFRAAAAAGVLALRTGDGYDALLGRLAGAARARLGDGAELELDPRDAGGVRARAGARSVDYTLPALAERCLDGLGEEIEGLWR